MTAIAKSAKTHPEATKCYGLEEPAIYFLDGGTNGVGKKIYWEEGHRTLFV